MQKQSYQNHLRFYYPHHFVFYPVLTALVVLGIRQAMQNEARSMEWLAITAIFVLIGWLSFMTRQHYALTLQNRMVRMEMRLRYYSLPSNGWKTSKTNCRFRNWQPFVLLRTTNCRDW